MCKIPIFLFFEKLKGGMKMIRVLSIEPGKKPEVKRIENTLKTLQTEVGGCIEVCQPFEDRVAIILNEEGKLIGLPLNRSISSVEGEIYDIFAGTFLVVGVSEDEFISLSEEQIERYLKYFKYPEEFIFLNGRIRVIKVIDNDNY